MFLLAIACGNTFILKPSEQDPLTPTRLAELFLEAGFPKEVLQVVHGGKEQVDQLFESPGHQGHFLWGSSPGRPTYLSNGHSESQARAVHDRRQKSHGGDARCQSSTGDQSSGRRVCGRQGSAAWPSAWQCLGTKQGLDSDVAEAIGRVKPGLWNDEDAGFGPLSAHKRGRECWR